MHTTWKRAEITKKKWNKAKAVTTACRKLRSFWYNAVREFVEETARHIHVDTGMSKASILPLAHAVRAGGNISMAANGPKRGVYHGVEPGIYDKTGYRSKKAGEEAAIWTFKNATPSDPKMDFMFKINVLQYYLHELGLGRGDSSSWDSLVHGREAMDRYIRVYMRSYIAKSIKDIIQLSEGDER